MQPSRYNQSDPNRTDAAFQADLNLLAGICHYEDVIVWDGDGTPDAMTTTGAPHGTNITSSLAFQYFVTGCEREHN